TWIPRRNRMRSESYISDTCFSGAQPAAGAPELPHCRIKASVDTANTARSLQNRASSGRPLRLGFQ
ncbi:hypothetical protein, partial [Paenirhodobacter populi]|uniref:hypothetical protein n=1 Tax=Paenirhodobacter populi TaxID=2306993 RepID=UPI003619891E